MRLKQHGLSLIEVLISVLILAVGLLGFAGLQTQAIRTNFDSLQRAKASALVEDLLDRMRANQAVAINTTQFERTLSATNPMAEPARDCSANVCNVNDMAEWQLYEWFTDKVLVQAPTATVTISKPLAVSTDPTVPANPRVVQVDIQMVEVTEGILNVDTVDDEIVTDQLVTFTYVTML